MENADNTTLAQAALVAHEALEDLAVAEARVARAAKEAWEEAQLALEVSRRGGRAARDAWGRASLAAARASRAIGAAKGAFSNSLAAQEAWASVRAAVREVRGIEMAEAQEFFTEAEVKELLAESEARAWEAAWAPSNPHIPPCLVPGRKRPVGGGQEMETATTATLASLSWRVAMAQVAWDMAQEAATRALEALRPLAWEATQGKEDREARAGAMEASMAWRETQAQASWAWEEIRKAATRAEATRED